MIVNLPTPQELAPWIQKLETHSGSVVLIAVELPEVCNFARATCASLSREERQAVRRALERCHKQRQKSHDVDRGDIRATESSKDIAQAAHETDIPPPL
jgi:hypothetical protein